MVGVVGARTLGALARRAGGDEGLGGGEVATLASVFGIGKFWQDFDDEFRQQAREREGWNIEWR